MYKILITGGLGYIGARIGKYLQDNLGAEIYPTTRNPGYGKPDWLKRGDVLSLDMENQDQILKCCQDKDIIIHLAALNEIECKNSSLKALEVNTLGTQRLLEIINKNTKIIYMSTAHVYGSPLEGVLTEDCPTFSPFAYAYSHRFSEDLVLANNAGHVVIRLSNSFGCPLSADINRWTLIVNNLCRQAVENKEIVLRGNGKDVRDYVTIHDLTRAVKHFIDNMDLDKPLLGTGTPNVFNLGGRFALKSRELADLIADRCQVVLGYKPNVVLGESGIDKSPELSYEIGKIEKTGFVLESPISKEIDDLLLFCKHEFL